MAKIEQNAYAAKYSKVAEHMTRLDAIEARLVAIEDEKRQSGGRVPQAEAAARFVEVVAARRAGVAAQVRTTAALTSEVTPNLGHFARSTADLLDLLILTLGDQIAEGGAAAILASEYVAGAPLAERDTKRATLAEERAALVVEHGDLVAAVRGVGIERVDLPENIEAAAKRAEEAKADAKRAEVEARSRALLDGVVSR